MRTNLNIAQLNGFDELQRAILTKKAMIGVIGLGYVGLPLIKAINRAGYKTIGYDTDPRKIRALMNGQSYIKTLTDDDVKDLMSSEQFKATNNVKDIADMDVVLICVPTPLTKNREPDMRFVVASAESIASHLRPNQLITLESTTYPGTTQELLQSILERNGLQAGHDFFIAYSPEREDPGNGVFETSTIPKVVGADDPLSASLAMTFYSQIVPQVVEVTSSRTAEAVKLTENIFRFVNIALVNELKCIYDKMGIDVWEVIDAAKTKPFGFMPFYPGPGIGGHCIPIDPFYLTWKAREYGMTTQMVELSGQINNQMSSYVIVRLRKELDQRFERGLKNSRILILGLAYKKNIDDMRESPALTIFSKLLNNQAQVDYYDPYVKAIEDEHDYPELNGRATISLTQEALNSYDAVVICADHDDVDYDFVVKNSKLIIDTRNAAKDVTESRENVVKA